MNKIRFIVSSIIDFLIYIYYKVFFAIIRKKKTETWVISERGIDARDNGYCFYKYIKAEHPEIDVKYIISKESADYHKIDENDVIIYRSKEHYYYFLYAKVLISAEIMGFSPNERLYYRLNKYGIIKIKPKTVFLQHGITKDYNSYMDKKNTKLDLFICGAIPEYNYMISKYGYNKEEVKLTGFSRFDTLKSCNQKIVLIMPTWRKWLKYEDSLVDTEFYNKYMELLNDKEIMELIEKNNYKMIFYPHIILQKNINEFYSCSSNVIIANFKNYDVQELLKCSEILITDYSSVAFDYAYMNKKVLYYHFDIKKYREQQYADGYFDYEEHGFGPVCYDLETIKKYIIRLLNDKNSLEGYTERVKNFFKYTDSDNNERIFNEIKNLIK